MMKTKKIINAAILSLGITLGVVHTASACTSMNPVAETATLGTYIVQRDTPIGTVIASVKSVAGSGLIYGNCFNPGNVYTKMVYGTATKSSIKDVYLTNIPGIGIRASLYSGWSNFNAPATVTAMTYGNATFNTNTGSSLELILIGPASSGTLTPGRVGVVTFDETPTIDSYVLNVAGGTINAVDCSIANKNINITLDDVLATDLTSVNSTAKPKDFDPGFNCQVGAKVNVKLTGTKNTDTSAPGVLQLSNAGSAGVAKGVGIQMLYNHAPLELNKNILLKTSEGGQETFTFTAQYFQTQSTVSTGSANATATLEITYQ